MARKSKAAAKPKPLVSGQQTLFSALGVKPSVSGCKRARSSVCPPDEDQAAAVVEKELIRRSSLDSGAEPSAAASSEPGAQPVLARRSSDAQTAQQRRIADVLLVLDFEATCDRHSQIQPQELIEFSSCILNTSSLVIEADFQQYVQPTEVTSLKEVKEAAHQ